MPRGRTHFAWTPVPRMKNAHSIGKTVETVEKNREANVHNQLLDFTSLDLQKFMFVFANQLNNTQHAETFQITLRRQQNGYQLWPNLMNYCIRHSPCSYICRSNGHARMAYKLENVNY